MKKRKRKIIRVGFKGKKFILDKYIVCDNYFSKARGLMFRPLNFKTPMVFIFNKKGKYPIHSLFCRKFIAIWIADDKIVEKRVVEPWKLSVVPVKKFDTLIEIPL
jgi:uncharacterized membrane protein (UPF0127 family)